MKEAQLYDSNSSKAQVVFVFLHVRRNSDDLLPLCVLSMIDTINPNPHVTQG